MRSSTRLTTDACRTGRRGVEVLSRRVVGVALAAALVLAPGCAWRTGGGAADAETGPRRSGWSIPSTFTLPAFTTIDLSRHAGTVVHNGARSRRAVALTFDDGPSPYTSRVLEILRAHGARATFFFIGDRTVGREQHVIDVLSAGSEIGDHTYEHVPLEKMTPASFDAEIGRTQRVFEVACGWSPPLLRPRGGHYDRSLLPFARDAGLIVVLWDVQADDTFAAGPTVDSIVRHATTVQNGSIVDMHETDPMTSEALPRIIDDLQARGFELVTVSELLRP